jgi:hypothetical protein
MWVGNMPTDADEPEIQAFFNKCPEGALPDEGADNQVESIFLISYTGSCFVNFRTNYALQTAVQRYNGIPLRAYDPTCPELLCKVRTDDDVAKAGVNAQRTTGMHRKWVRDRERKAAAKVR